MKIRGWIAIAAHYKRDDSTVRKWIKPKGKLKDGCPVTIEGRAHVVDTKTFTPWLDKTYPEWRKHDEPKEPKSVGEGTQKQLDKQKLRKLTADADKAVHEQRARAGITATRDEMVEAYSTGMRRVKRYVEKFVKHVKAANPEMSASSADELDREMVAMFNEIALGRD